MPDNRVITAVLNAKTETANMMSCPKVISCSRGKMINKLGKCQLSKLNEYLY